MTNVNWVQIEILTEFSGFAEDPFGSLCLDIEVNTLTNTFAYLHLNSFFLLIAQVNSILRRYNFRHRC